RGGGGGGRGGGGGGWVGGGGGGGGGWEALRRPDQRPVRQARAAVVVRPAHGQFRAAGGVHKPNCWPAHFHSVLARQRRLARAHWPSCARLRHGRSCAP